MAPEENVGVAKDDLWTAWMVLENLAVSLDQIGGKFGVGDRAANGTETQPTLHEALAGYLTPTLVQAINEARIRLGVCPRIRRHSPFGGVSFAYLILFRPSMTSAGRSRSARA